MSKTKEIQHLIIFTKFNDQELTELNDLLVTHTSNMFMQEEEKADSMSTYSLHLKTIRDEMKRVVKSIKIGGENRSVECDIWFDYDKNEKTIIRKDTKEIVETRPLNEDERQVAFSFAKDSDN